MDARPAPLPRRASGSRGRGTSPSTPPGGGPQDPAGGPRPPFVAPPIVGLHARQAALVVGLLLVAWIIFIFGRAVATTSAAQAHAAELRAANAAQEERLAEEQTELATVQSQTFIQLQARAYGVGAPGERPFALTADAPSPRPITPLGAPATTPAPQTPLGAWLDLLFGP